MVDDRINPYVAPVVQDQCEEPNTERLAAIKYLHVALMILLLPTVCNWAALLFLLPLNTHLEYAWAMRRSFAIGNAVGLALVFAAVWLCGLRLLEAVALAAHRLGGRGTPRASWLDVLYRGMHRLPRAAVVGSLVWLAWLVLYFFAGRPGGFALDVVFQIAGHAIGAWVYLPILYRWFMLHAASVES